MVISTPNFLSIFLLASFFIGTDGYPPVGSLYSTKTPYNLTWSDWDAVIPERHECQLIHVNALLRHGTRSPDRSDLIAVENFIARLQQEAAKYPHALPEKYRPLLEWQPQFPGDETLLERGKIEHKFLAKNFIQLFRESGFVSELTEEAPLISFRTSSYERAQESCQVFRDVMEQSYGRLGKTLINDTLTRFFELCPRYSDQVSHNASASWMEKLFEQSSYVRNIVSLLPKRLNLTQLQINVHDVVALWSVAGIEIAAGLTSPLPILFEENDLEILDYLEDLSTYWTKAYGYPIDSSCSCPFISEIFATFRSAIESSEKSAVFQFGHAETLIPVLAAFNLFHDSAPLSVETASRYLHNRQFRMSTVSPFAGNVAFLLYDCHHHHHYRKEANLNIHRKTGEKGRHRVQVLVNGEPVRLAGPCPNNNLCSLRSLSSFYQPLVNCDFGTICSL